MIGLPSTLLDLQPRDDRGGGGGCADLSATRVAFRLRRSLRFSELFLVPIIGCTEEELPLCDPVRWTWIERTLADALDEWLGTQTPRSVFARLYPYEWIASWSAEALRAHVLSTVPGCGPGKLTFLSQSLDLPVDAPQLGFLCLVLTTSRGWPQWPVRGGERFRDVVAHALQGPEERPPVVLAPGSLPCAVLEGLFCWLRELQREAQVTAWSIDLTPASAEVVRITLTLATAASPIQFAVRIHQIGSEGLRHLIQLLSDMAPML